MCPYAEPEICVTCRTNTWGCCHHPEGTPVEVRNACVGLMPRPRRRDPEWLWQDYERSGGRRPWWKRILA